MPAAVAFVLEVPGDLRLLGQEITLKKGSDELKAIRHAQDGIMALTAGIPRGMRVLLSISQTT
jgi:hypothetical protein